MPDYMNLSVASYVKLDNNGNHDPLDTMYEANKIPRQWLWGQYSCMIDELIDQWANNVDESNINLGCVMASIVKPYLTNDYIVFLHNTLKVHSHFPGNFWVFF